MNATQKHQDKMRKLLLFTIAICSTIVLQAQEITGQWNGILKIQGSQLTIVFNVEKTENGYSGTMDSPDQGAKGIPMTTVSFDNYTLKISNSTAKLEYEGLLDEQNIINGNFKQGGYSFPLNLSREKVKKERIAKPQEPTKPYSYNSEDITYENKDAGIRLAGTLTIPKGKGLFPAVILISGSGAQNRDEELLGHKPFLVLSDYLTKNGIAVLRFDDRGTAESEGNHNTATSLDFATDVEAGVQYLKTRKEIDQKNIGLIGHSEGGMIAPIVASRSKDISFIVLNAGLGIPGDKLLLLQNNLISKASGISDEILAENDKTNANIYNIIKSSKDTNQLKSDLSEFYKKSLKDNPNTQLPNGMTEDDYVKIKVNAMTSPWMQYFIKFNPETFLKKVKCPVLAINGTNDLQVPAKENLLGIKTALEKNGNKNVTTTELANLNHLFQESKTGLPSEYSQIEQTISPVALELITSWIKEQTK